MRDRAIGTDDANDGSQRVYVPTICSGNRPAKSGGIDCLAVIRRDLVAPAAQAFLILSCLFALDAVTSCEIHFLTQVDANQG
jgi:hypothetical protein